MTISIHPVADYKADLIIRLRQQLEGYRSTPYYDMAPANSAGEYQSVTIGDGININWSNATHLRLVLNQIGVVSSADLQEANRRAVAGLPPETPAERTRSLNGMIAGSQPLGRELASVGRQIAEPPYREVRGQ